MNEEIANIGENLPEWFLSAMAVPREDLEMDINGTPVRYFRWGDKNKPPVILLHGFLSHRRCWAFIAPLLAEKYNLFALDLAGMGDSGTSNGYQLEDRIEEITTFVEQLNLKQKPILCGHSFGGGIYIQLASRKPDLARGIIACDVFMVLPKDIDGWISSERFQRPPPSNKRKLYPDWESIHARYVLSPPQPVAHSFLFEYMAKHSTKQIDEGWTWKFDPDIMQRDEAERFWWTENLDAFCKIEIPKAIIYGKKSQLVNKKLIDYVGEKSKTPFEIFGIEDAHHHIMLDKPLELAAAIDKTLSQWFKEN